MLDEERQRILIDALFNKTGADDLDDEIGLLFETPREEWSAYTNVWWTYALLRYYRRHQSKEQQRDRARRRRLQMSATADGTWPHWRTLIEEDGPMCAICGDDVVPGATEWDLRPTADHIVALFSGGKHTRSNAQAHHRCNSDKAQF
jgi:hypothetical protein